jgi:hypothetical protein
MGRIGGPTTAMKALVTVACVVLLVSSGCSDADHGGSG